MFPHVRNVAGQRSFRKNVRNLVRLRRIHCQKGADAYKESTMRLRDAAMTVEDYQFCKTYEFESVDPS